MVHRRCTDRTPYDKEKRQSDGYRSPNTDQTHRESTVAWEAGAVATPIFLKDTSIHASWRECPRWAAMLEIAMHCQFLDMGLASKIGGQPLAVKCPKALLIRLTVEVKREEAENRKIVKRLIILTERLTEEMHRQKLAKIYLLFIWRPLSFCRTNANTCTTSSASGFLAKGCTSLSPDPMIYLG